MLVRSPAVAGQFYPRSAEECRSAIEQCLHEAARFESTAPPPDVELLGGVVPHAGWVCSGALAGQVLSVLAGHSAAETYVVFGAVHRRMSPAAAVYDRGAWETPLGAVLVDEELADAAVEASPLVVSEPETHAEEHSIEVEVPFIQQAAPQARLLPVMVSPTPSAPLVGRAVAEAARRLGRRVAFVGSTDLTHYGPRYRFAPRGVGAEGLAWAKTINDRRMLDLMTALRDEDAVIEAAEHRNACGAGAIAATIAACKAAGATAGYVLRHTTSNEVLRTRCGDMDDAVGYAGVVFGRTAA